MWAISFRGWFVWLCLCLRWTRRVYCVLRTPVTSHVLVIEFEHLKCVWGTQAGMLGLGFNTLNVSQVSLWHSTKYWNAESQDPNKYFFVKLKEGRDQEPPRGCTEERYNVYEIFNLRLSILTWGVQVRELSIVVPRKVCFLLWSIGFPSAEITHLDCWFRVKNTAAGFWRDSWRPQAWWKWDMILSASCSMDQTIRSDFAAAKIQMHVLYSNVYSLQKYRESEGGVCMLPISLLLLLTWIIFQQGEEYLADSLVANPENMADLVLKWPAY